MIVNLAQDLTKFHDYHWEAFATTARSFRYTRIGKLVREVRVWAAEDEVHGQPQACVFFMVTLATPAGALARILQMAPSGYWRLGDRFHRGTFNRLALAGGTAGSAAGGNGSGGAAPAAYDLIRHKELQLGVASMAAEAWMRQLEPFLHEGDGVAGAHKPGAGSGPVAGVA